MKKRTLTIIAVLAAISMLSFAVFAGNSSFEGYERFKDLLRNNEIENAHAGQGSIKITDNGTEVLNLQAQFAGSEDHVGSGQVTIKADNLDKTLKFYGQDQTMYLVDGNDVYKKTHEAYEGHEKYERNEKDFDQQAEAVMDFFMGDFKDDFTLEGDNIVFELTKEEMPAFLNMMTSDVDHKHDKHERHKDMDLAAYPLFNELQALENILPELDNTSLDYIKFVMKVEDNKLSGMTFQVEVSGVDADGKSHALNITGDFDKADDLTVETFELTDQKVYELPEDKE